MKERTNRGYRWGMALSCLQSLWEMVILPIVRSKRQREALRKARLVNLEVPGMSREELKDREELETELEYRKGLDKIQNAFRILKRTS